MTTLRQLLAPLATGQHGLAERSQVLDLGATPEMIEAGLRQGLIERVHPRVYLIPGSPRTLKQSLMAACLSADGVASHRAAAWLWGLNGPFSGHVEGTIPRRKAPDLRAATIHCSSDLIPDDVTAIDGIPVTKPARTLVDLGAVSPRWDVDAAINTALARRLVTIEGLWMMLARVARKGRSGAGVLRECLEWRSAVPDSVLEALFLQVVRDHDLPKPVLQYPVTVNGRQYRIDAAYPEVMLAIELDGADTHISPDALQRDLRRQNDLVEAGFSFLRFPWGDLTLRKPHVARQVRTMHDRLSFSRQKTA